MARTAHSSYTAGRVVMTIAEVIASIIAIAIVFVLLHANPSNMLVHAFHEIAQFFAQPFDGLFSLSTPERTILVNWGLAAIVYLVIGAVVARIVRR